MTDTQAGLLPCPVCKGVMIHEPHDPKEWATVPEHYDCPHCGTIVQSKGIEILKRQAGAAVQVPEGWKLVRWDYTSLFNAIGAATKAQQGGAVEVSVKAFKEAMLAADLASQLAAAPQKQGA